MGMVCKPCRTAKVRADKAHTRNIMGEGRNFKERQRECVLCLECRKKLAKGSLVAHRQTQHGVAKGGSGKVSDEESGGNDPRTFRMAFPAKAGPRTCPVEGCSFRAAIQTAMRVHFWHWHIWDTVVILEEGNLPHPRYPLRGMLVPWRSLNGMHRRTAQCRKGAERK